MTATASRTRRKSKRGIGSPKSVASAVYVIDRERHRHTVIRLHGPLKLATAHVATEEQPRSFAASNPPTTKILVFCAPSKPKGRIRSTFLIHIRVTLMRTMLRKPNKFKPAKTGNDAGVAGTSTTFHTFVAAISHLAVTYSPGWHSPTSLVFHSWLWQTKTSPTSFHIFAHSFKQRGH